jgi:hypothetical protein
MFSLVLYDDPRFHPIYQDSYERIEARLKHWFDNDGGWLEKADTYTSAVIQQLFLYQETLVKTLGEDIFNKDYDEKSIAEICQWYPKILPPDGLTPGLNDGTWAWLPFLQLCAYRSQDPTTVFAIERTLWGSINAFGGRNFRDIDGNFDLIAWADSTLASSPPSWTSTLLPDTGLAVLRSNWSTDAQYLLFLFPQSFNHLHYNFGNIVLYDQGPWLLDNGYQLFNTNGERDYEQWYRSKQSIDHSTMTIDNQNHSENHGEVDFYAALNESAMVSAYTKTYPFIYQSRTVLWANSWHQWLIVDSFLPLDSLPHTYQQRWYISADQVIGSGNHWEFDRDGRQLFIDLVPTPTGGPVNYSQISRTYNTPQTMGNALGVMMDSPYFYLPAALITTPQVGESQPGIFNVARQDADQLMVVTSQRRNETLAWLYAVKPLWESEIYPYNLNGRAGCILTKSEIVGSYCMFDGKQLSYQGQLLAKADTRLSVDVSFSLNEIGLNAQENTPISLYWPGQVSVIVDENGVAIPFTYTSEMLSFTSPIGSHSLTVQGSD